MIERVCQFCGESFQAYPSDVKKGWAKYCSRKCKHLAMSKKVTRTCQHCGQTFEVAPSIVKHSGAKFCSRECTDAAHRKPPVFRLCEYCSNEFEVVVTRPNQRYCSVTCGHLSRRRKIARICKYCGQEFDVIPSRIKRGDPAIYCSQECHYADRGRRKEWILKICEQCGREFEVQPSAKTQRFCSRKCANLAQRTMHGCAFSDQEVRTNRRCQVCNKEFWVTPARIKKGEGMYCSLECFYSTHRTTCHCAFCGKEFERRNSSLQADQKLFFCSYECSGAYHSGERSGGWQGGKSFEPYTPEFNERFKREIRKRDKYTCAICGEPGKCVHHVDYDKANTVPENCITLCRPCHTKTNTNREFWQETLSGLLSEDD